MDLFKQFDAYSLKARVFPALIASLPALAALFVLVPWNALGPPQAIATAIGFVLLFAFADVARQRGRQIEQKLGSNRTPELWFRGSSDIPNAGKDRYRAFVAGELKKAAPTQQDEAQQPERAKDFYLAANTWLREHTRDTKKFSLLFGENITYGFRRNLLGLKSVALCMNAIVVTAMAVIYYTELRYFQAIGNLDDKLVIIAAGAILHSLYMLLAVGKAAVWDASRAYGRQLILCCETLMKPARAPAAKKPRKPDVGR